MISVGNLAFHRPNFQARYFICDSVRDVSLGVCGIFLVGTDSGIGHNSGLPTNPRGRCLTMSRL